jgi:hypothetical protein
VLLLLDMGEHEGRFLLDWSLESFELSGEVLQPDGPTATSLEATSLTPSQQNSGGPQLDPALLHSNAPSPHATCLTRPHFAEAAQFCTIAPNISLAPTRPIQSSQSDLLPSSKVRTCPKSPGPMDALAKNLLMTSLPNRFGLR